MLRMRTSHFISDAGAQSLFNPAHETHSLCTLFPEITGHDFDALVADIKENGLLNPIITLTTRYSMDGIGSTPV